MIRETVDASSLPALLEEAVTAGIKLITVDCFDTLLWRVTSSPYDVFVEASQRSHWKVFGITPAVRVAAETAARKQAFVERGAHEVTLTEIFQAVDPTFTASDVARLVRDELDCEFELTLLFQPMVEFMEAARLRGLSLAIVSDTYLSSDQLAALFDDYAHNFPIFCSSEHRRSKSEGLIGVAAEACGFKPAEVMHIGDNPVADVLGARASGAHGVLFETFEARVVSRERAAEGVVSVMLPEVRATKALFNTRKFVHANKPSFASREEVIGYTVVGPIVHAFALQVRADHDRVRDNGRELAFMMRDGFLVKQAYDWLFAEQTDYRESACVEVSRFTAWASSFVDENDVELYLNDHVFQGVRLDVPARHLGIAMPQTFATTAEQVARFKDLVRVSIPQVLEHSASMRERLKKYLSRNLLNRPSTIIDLGYTGTAERRLRRAFPGIDLDSYYLIALAALGENRQNRRALIGMEPDDHRIAAALMKVVAPLEVWCSSGEGSVVDYTEAGEPIRAGDYAPPAMRESARQVQAAALAYVRDAMRHDVWSAYDEARQAVVGLLGSVGYMASFDDLELLRRMSLDVNLGTEHSVPMIDLTMAHNQLTRRGLLYLDAVQERSMVQGAELRAEGVELSLTMLNVIRYGVPLAKDDMTLRRMRVMVRAVPDDGGESEALNLVAHGTHDGFNAVDFPNMVGDCKAVFGIGEWEYLQLAAVLVMPIEIAGTRAEMNLARPSEFTWVETEAVAQGLLKTKGSSATLVVPSPKGTVVRVVFRPLASRQKQTRAGLPAV